MCGDVLVPIGIAKYFIGTWNQMRSMLLNFPLHQIQNYSLKLEYCLRGGIMLYFMNSPHDDLSGLAFLRRNWGSQTFCSNSTICYTNHVRDTYSIADQIIPNNRAQVHIILFVLLLVSFLNKCMYFQP